MNGVPDYPVNLEIVLRDDGVRFNWRGLVLERDEFQDSFLPGLKASLSMPVTARLVKYDEGWWGVSTAQLEAYELPHEVAARRLESFIRAYLRGSRTLEAATTDRRTVRV